MNYPRLLRQTIRTAGLIALVGAGSAFADTQTATSYLVQITPNTLQTNVAADIEIKALDANGEIIKDYDGSVMMDVNQGTQGTDYTLPTDFTQGWYYDYKTTDQGDKTFSKGIKFMTNGTYTVTVSDLIESYISGSATVIVGDGKNSNQVWNTLIESPVDKQKVTGTTTTIIGSNASLANTNVQVVVNGVPSSITALSSADGSFTIPVTNLTGGDNTIQVRMIWPNNTSLSDSAIITVTSSANTSALIKKFDADPLTGITEGDSVNFVLNTDDSVNSAKIVIAGISAIMKKDSSGGFSYTWIATGSGDSQVDLVLTTDAGDTTVTSAKTVTVAPGDNTVKNIKGFTDELKPNTLNLSWETTVFNASFDVSYGIAQNTLDTTLQINKTGVNLTGVDTTKKLYISITALDSNGNAMGSGRLYTWEPSQNAAPRCIIQGIPVTPQQIGNQYFLMRNPVPGASSYTIYRSSNATNSIDGMDLVTTTTTTQYQYPFNPHASKDTYDYFAVVANCQDGQKLTVDSIKKVKVGPTEDLMFVLMVTIFSYIAYRIYRIV